MAETEGINQSDDTVRVDPLDSFKKYRGGYDIRNKHYWSVSLHTTTTKEERHNRDLRTNVFLSTLFSLLPLQAYMDTPLL